ncbi:hypothetical protein HDU76_006369 [Blyttiomyces sp. JEL0837]|nr:hypothetical protein HDU76_006369 [Blyttiomyces sp. JEL0837]
MCNQATGARSRITLTQALMLITQREVALTALGVFAGMAGLIVMLFLFYQISLVMSGKTTNEVFKWEDLEYDIKSKTIAEIPEDLLRFNELQHKGAVKRKSKMAEIIAKDTLRKRKGKGVATKEESNDEFKRDEDGHVIWDPESKKVPLTSSRQIRNIYDRGPLLNLYEVLFPVPIK